MPTSWIFGVMGGLVVGSAGALLLASHGRIAGISGISFSLLRSASRDRWRVAFFVGLVAAGLIGRFVAPGAVSEPPRALAVVLLAGVLVGFGTRMGSGCTSGHGVCGVSRLSPRSLMAVATFITTGAVTAMLMRGIA